VGGDWFTENVTLVHGLVEGARLGKEKEVHGTNRLYRKFGVKYTYTLQKSQDSEGLKYTLLHRSPVV
jgi:hypothetical protein